MLRPEVDVNARGTNGWGALMIAAANGQAGYLTRNTKKFGEVAERLKALAWKASVRL